MILIRIRMASDKSEDVLTDDFLEKALESLSQPPVRYMFPLGWNLFSDEEKEIIKGCDYFCERFAGLSVLEDK